MLGDIGWDGAGVLFYFLSLLISVLEGFDDLHFCIPDPSLY
jgi:hypothetical protein